MTFLQLLELGELCGLLPDQEKSSANLHAVVMLSAGIADSDPSEKLKHALSSKDAFTKEYLVSCINGVDRSCISVPIPF